MIPIGEVIYRLDQEFKQGNVPGYKDAADLYRDRAHLTKDIGRFVAGTTVYSTIFKENLVVIDRPSRYYLDTDKTTNLTVELRNLIQSIVWEVVSRHPLSGVDITPDDFILGNILDAKLSHIHFSKKISVSNINTTSVISITDGEYSINSGEFTKEKGIVHKDDIIIVRFQSSDSYSTERTATLTIGGASNSFSVTTMRQSEEKKAE